MTDLIFILLLTAICFALGTFIDYALGQPGKSYDFGEGPGVSEILFFWSFFLAKWRLKRMGKYEQFPDNGTDSSDKMAAEAAKRAFKIDVFNMARDFFTWEKMLGMCIMCTNWWLSMAVCIVLVFVLNVYSFTALPSWMVFVTVPYFSHFILRKI